MTNSNTEIFPIFPTMIARGNYRVSEKEKDSYFNVLKHQFDDEGKTGEERGYLALQTLEPLHPIYNACVNVVKEKLKFFHIDPYAFEIHITKSWMNVVSGQSTPLHAHYDAHWSFTYYLNVPQGISNRLQFEQRKHPNDPYNGMILFGSTHFDAFNALTLNYDPNEGDIYVFPSSLLHSTVGEDETKSALIKTSNDMKNNRICIAGDILFIHKNPTKTCLGIQPRKKWLTF